MLSQQQRASYSAGKQGSKSTSATASTSTTTNVKLPPALTEKALSTLCQLPIRSDSTLKWQRYDCGSGSNNVKDTQIAYESLLQLSLAEYRAFECGTIRSPLPLLQTTLWAIERNTSHSTDGDCLITSIWLFNIQSQEKLAESSSAASGEERRKAAGCKDVVEHCLSKLKAVREQGSNLLQDFYVGPTTTYCDDPLILAPSPKYGRLLRYFIKALDEHFLASWAWSGSEQQEVHTGNVHANSSSASKKPQVKEEGERDEEEEGAIRDGATGTSHLDSKLEYWPKSHLRSSRRVVRFGRGIVLQTLKRSNSLFHDDRSRDRQAVCLTLRCFIEEQGHIYIETRPMRANGMQHIEDTEISNQKALLAPSGIQVDLIERIKDLSWVDKDDRESEKQALECKQTLLAMLQVRGVDVDGLDDDWMICETEKKGKFLWPTKLCFAIPAEQDREFGKVDQQSLPIFLKPLLDIAERAKGLVRESVGMRNVMGNGDAMMLELADQQDEEGDDDGTDADAEDQLEEEEDKRKEEKIDVNSGEIDVASTTVRKEGNSPLHELSLDTADQGKPSTSTKDDEETDLWGTFGFGLQDDNSKDLDRRQSVAGLDEGGFGLITEDDFDFFDEAAKGVGSFEDMDVDLGQQDVSDSRGDATFQSLDTDNGSDLAMTNSTFLDPPSLPGFTPGSLSATSENDAKAVGGLNAKTPRTPFSPSQDLGDAHVSIEGESDSFFHESRRLHSHPQNISFDQINSGILEPKQDGKSDMINEGNHTWSPQNREHLMSKYEQGKFALPHVTNRKRSDAEGLTGAGSRNEREAHPRNRLRHRAQSARRLSGVRSALSRKLKLGSTQQRGEEELSDVEATVDGTVSDRSSLMNEDSDDEMTSASEDTSEEEGIRLQDRLSLLQSSIEAVEGYPHPPTKQEPSADLPDLGEFDIIKDTKIAASLNRLTSNPQVRLCVCPAQTAKNDTLVRSLAKELFTPLPLTPEDNNLSVLLSGSKAKQNVLFKTSIQLLEAPKIMVGCQGAIASMEPTALSFWEKLGLSAVSGPKNVAAMGLHCGCLPASWQNELLDWFGAFNDTFRRNGLGQQTLADDALLALGDSFSTSVSLILVQTSKNAEQWTDTIDSLLSRMHSHLSNGQFVVIYAVGVQVQSHCIWVLSKLEMDLREAAKSRWGTAPDLINVRGIRWDTIATSMRAVTGPSSIFRLALSLYDSLNVPIQPHYNHKDHLPTFHSEPVGIIHPSFTLSPVNHMARSQTRFQLQWKSEPFNLMDAGLLLNVAYHIAQAPGELTFISIMDEKAQGYFVDGWRRRGDLQGELKLIWKRVQYYAARARVLWRIVICKRGQMQMLEVKLWSLILKQPSDSLRAIDITLTCLDLFTPMNLVPPRQKKSDVGELAATGPKRLAKEADDKTAHYIDATQVDYAIYPHFRIAMCQEDKIDGDEQEKLLPLQSSATVSLSDRYNGSVAASSGDEDNTWPQTAPRHFWIHLLQIYKAPYSTYQDTLTIQERTSIITKSFHQLAFISRERFYFTDNLPWHISILATAIRAGLLF